MQRRPQMSRSKIPNGKGYPVYCIVCTSHHPTEIGNIGQHSVVSRPSTVTPQPTAERIGSRWWHRSDVVDFRGAISVFVFDKMIRLVFLSHLEFDRSRCVAAPPGRSQILCATGNKRRRYDSDFGSKTSVIITERRSLFPPEPQSSYPTASPAKLLTSGPGVGGRARVERRDREIRTPLAHSLSQRCG
jgi:hypothetical protein